MPDLPFHPDRLQTLEALKDSGVQPWPARPPENRHLATEILGDFASFEGKEACIAGRIRGRRGYGKLVFLDLEDRSGQIQAVLEKANLSAEEFTLTKSLNLGDFVEVIGTCKPTQKGQPSVYGACLRILSKSLLETPKWHGVQDVELRARRRYLDLCANAEVRERFLKRSALIQAIRESLLGADYHEVETPVLHPIYGGAMARPFRTQHNSLDMELYLRIAPELYLKRLLVGGMERVFEIARVFRNEGLSPRHNPEFTMLEFYEAYTDWEGMVERTEALIVAAAEAAGCRNKNGLLQTTFREQTIALDPPFERKRWQELFHEHVGCDPLDQNAVTKALQAQDLDVLAELSQAGPEVGRLAWWKAVNDLFESKVEPQLQGPIFVTHYPAAICPLAKPCADDPVWAERFEFFLGGMELANAFSELNDPILQLEHFEEQVADADPEAPNAVDHDYVRALAYGMPPAGGCGVGLDRLAMVLLGVDSIREVLLFPHLRPESDGSAP